eukprot:scaffold118909_cov37-Tisochrysis_lutea.AAC.2
MRPKTHPTHPPNLPSHTTHHQTNDAESIEQELEPLAFNITGGHSLRRGVISALLGSFSRVTSAPPPPALFLPERVFPPAWTRGEGVLGCARSVRALGGGQISRGGGSATSPRYHSDTWLVRHGGSFRDGKVVSN